MNEIPKFDTWEWEPDLDGLAALEYSYGVLYALRHQEQGRLDVVSDNAVTQEYFSFKAIARLVVELMDLGKAPDATEGAISTADMAVGVWMETIDAWDRDRAIAYAIDLAGEPW